MKKLLSILNQQQVFFAELCAYGFIIVLLILFAYIPTVQRISNDRNTLSDFVQRKFDPVDLMSEINRIQDSLTSVRAQNQSLEDRIGDRQSIGRILDVLSEYAGNDRIDLTAILPREDKNSLTPRDKAHSFLKTLPLTLKIRGQFKQIGDFLGRFPDAPFLGSIKNLSVAQISPTSLELEASVIIDIYVIEETAPNESNT